MRGYRGAIGLWGKTYHRGHREHTEHTQEEKEVFLMWPYAEKTYSRGKGSDCEAADRSVYDLKSLYRPAV
ncbi:MAG: hypothetical protein CMJ25_29655 [Phycisphaerae bacterium]|nr:hypothetical protein [Phycisphaerae bacterium]